MQIHNPKMKHHHLSLFSNKQITNDEENEHKISLAKSQVTADSKSNLELKGKLQFNVQ